MHQVLLNSTVVPRLSPVVREAGSILAKVELGAVTTGGDSLGVAPEGGVRGDW